jgi:hypothetical protein
MGIQTYDNSANRLIMLHVRDKELIYRAASATGDYVVKWML